MDKEKLFELIMDCKRALRKLGMADPEYLPRRYETRIVAEHFNRGNFAKARKFIKEI